MDFYNPYLLPTATCLDPASTYKHFQSMVHLGFSSYYQELGGSRNWPFLITGANVEHFSSYTNHPNF